VEIYVNELVESTNGELKFVQKKGEGAIGDIKVTEESIMAIDGSTDITGVAIIEIGEPRINYSMSFHREKDTEESPVAFKVRMKKEIKKIFINNPDIKQVIYEEPFVGYINATENLLMLRTSVEEIIFEEEPKLDYLKYHEINNKRWKRLFLEPKKMPNNSKLEKKMVREKLISIHGICKNLGQDEVDAIALGLVSISLIKKKGTIQSKKKTRPFQFKAEFVGSKYVEAIMADLSEYDIPQEVMQNGVLVDSIGPRENFEKAIYNRMGSDDKLLILEFDSRNHGDVVLKYRLGDIISFYDTIYALVWRKRRKVS
jgi:hypothetical protein